MKMIREPFGLRVEAVTPGKYMHIIHPAVLYPIRNNMLSSGDYQKYEPIVNQYSLAIL